MVATGEELELVASPNPPPLPKVDGRVIVLEDFVLDQVAFVSAEIAALSFFVQFASTSLVPGDRNRNRC